MIPTALKDVSLSVAPPTVTQNSGAGLLPKCDPQRFGGGSKHRSSLAQQEENEGLH